MRRKIPKRGTTGNKDMVELTNVYGGVELQGEDKCGCRITARVMDNYCVTETVKIVRLTR